MLIKQLEVIVYPQPGYKSHVELTDDPDWPEIDAAIQRLDRHEYPFLRLYLAAGSGSIVHHLNIIGGKGEYGLTGFDERHHERFRFRDLSRSNGPGRIEIWTSDQERHSKRRTYAMTWRSYLELPSILQRPVISILRSIGKSEGLTKSSKCEPPTREGPAPVPGHSCPTNGCGGQAAVESKSIGLGWP